MLPIVIPTCSWSTRRRRCSRASDPERRDALVARIVEYVDDGGRVALVLRSDFYARLAGIDGFAPFAGKAAVSSGRCARIKFTAPSLNPRQRPASGWNRTWSKPSWTTSLARPSRCRCCPRRWCAPGSTATVTCSPSRAYRLRGRVRGALEAAAEECFARLDGPAPACRHLLVGLADAVRVRAGSAAAAASRRRAGDEPDQRALDALVGARLVTVADRESRSPTTRCWHTGRGCGTGSTNVRWPPTSSSTSTRSATAWRTVGAPGSRSVPRPSLAGRSTDWRAGSPRGRLAGREASSSTRRFTLPTPELERGPRSSARGGARPATACATSSPGWRPPWSWRVAGGAVAVHERGPRVPRRGARGGRTHR